MEKLRKINSHFYMGVFLSLCFIFTIGHVDCNTITTWGYDLLDSIRTGHFRAFPTYTYEMHQMPTNYSLFTNAITAVWLLPVYLIDMVSKGEIAMMVYDTWYKTFVCLVHFLNMYLFYKILTVKKYKDDDRLWAMIYYMASTVVLVTVLGKGQVDNIVLLLLLMGYLAYLNEKDISMSICFGLSLCIKPFSILLIVPFLILYMEKRGWKCLGYGMISVGIYIFEKIFSHLLMPDYEKMNALTSQMFKEAFGSSRVEQLFAIRSNYVVIYWAIAIVICFICYDLASKKKVKEYHYLLFPTLMFILFGILVSDTCYWFILIIPGLIVMGLKLKNREHFLLLYFLSNMGTAVYTLFLEGEYSPRVEMTWISFFSNRLTENRLVHVLEVYKDYVCYIGTTLFLVPLLLLCIVFGMECFNIKSGGGEKDVTAEKLFRVLLFVPAVCYLLVAYLSFWRV